MRLMGHTMGANIILQDMKCSHRWPSSLRIKHDCPSVFAKVKVKNSYLMGCSMQHLRHADMPVQESDAHNMSHGMHAAAAKGEGTRT